MTREQQVAPPRRRTRTEVQQLVAELAHSGMSASEFCRTRGLSQSTLYRHLQRRRSTGNPARTGSQLLAVEVRGMNRCSPSYGSEMEVVLTNGRRIEVNPGFDVATLERLLSVLERV